MVSCVDGGGGALFPFDLLFIGSSLMLILVAFQMLRDLFKREEIGLSAGKLNRTMLFLTTALMFTLNVVSAYMAFLTVELAVGGGVAFFIHFANLMAVLGFWLAIRAWWKQHAQSDFC